MGKTIKKCRICGKEYPMCVRQKNHTAFDYHEVACGPECGKEYFRRIAEQRENKTKKGANKNNVPVRSKGDSFQS